MVALTMPYGSGGSTVVPSAAVIVRAPTAVDRTSARAERDPLNLVHTIMIFKEISQVVHVWRVPVIAPSVQLLAQCFEAITHESA
jgi:hypothetical protein